MSRNVFINKESGVLGKELQSKSVDTILQLSDEKEIYIEEKIVRFPTSGKKYTAFTLEEMSCTTEGREKTGWMEYGKFDYLFYGFVQQDDSIELYIIPFQKLKTWFWGNNNNYPSWFSSQINRTQCRIVPIKDIEEYVGYKKYFIKELAPV